MGPSLSLIAVAEAGGGAASSSQCRTLQVIRDMEYSCQFNYLIDCLHLPPGGALGSFLTRFRLPSQTSVGSAKPFSIVLLIYKRKQQSHRAFFCKTTFSSEPGFGGPKLARSRCVKSVTLCQSFKITKCGEEPIGKLKLGHAGTFESASKE